MTMKDKQIEEFERAAIVLNLLNIRADAIEFADGRAGVRVEISEAGRSLRCGTYADAENLCAVLNGARTAAKEIEELTRDLATFKTACEGYSAQNKALVEECDRLRAERDALLAEIEGNRE